MYQTLESISDSELREEYVKRWSGSARRRIESASDLKPWKMQTPQER